MAPSENLEGFYKRKFDWIPDDIRSSIGHFNVFQLDPFVGKNAKPVPYKKRDFYKVMLVKGPGRVHYADKVIEVKKQALSFSNPQIPYKWEHDRIRSGHFCIFNQAFFHQFGDLNKYSVFQPNGPHIFELTNEQAAKVEQVFTRMHEEIQSEYVHRYDVLRNQVFELIHFALKTQPSKELEAPQQTASQRIATLFLDLLERQFPIEENHPQVRFRTPSDFAEQLNVHVNHLNRSVKQATGKTTSQLIAERILLESKVLLRHSVWNISEVAYALGFSEATHFSNFFKKHTQSSPLQFRSA